MRTFYKTLSALMAFGMLSTGVANAQTSVLTEGFESSTFAPVGWTNTLINLAGGSGTSVWYRVTSGSSPSVSPHGGSAMASYNIYSLYAGSRAEMATPPLTFPSGTEISFWMYRDGGYLGYSEGLKVYYNTSAPTYSGGVLLATINRPTDMAPTESSDGWYKYTVPIPVSGSNIYIIFEGFSDYGNNMFIDDIDIYYFCNSPGSVVASNVQQNSVSTSWSAVSGSAGYEYILDQTPGTPLYAGTKTTATSQNFTGLSSGTTYYMHVRNKCVSGAYSDWVTTSFATPPGSSCNAISGLNANPVTSTVVKLKFTGTSPSAGYEYVIDDKPIDPVSGYVATNLTSLNVYGLEPLKTYYAHVRNVCAGNYSAWNTAVFTMPDCSRPNNIFYTSIGSHTVDLIWSLMPNVQQYEYMVDVSPTAYTNPVNAVITTGITGHVKGLSADTKYYSFVRSRCFAGTDSSEWKIDSFVTSFECGAPDLKVTGIGTNAPIATWDDVPKAIAYEYAVTNSAALPSFGAEIFTTTVALNLPADGKAQYLHVRTKCNSMFTVSDWATEQLRTTSVEVLATAAGIQVYPNPVKDRVNIVTEAATEYTLTDITGRVILTGQMAESGYINMDGFANGAYILKCTVDSQTAMFKLIKE